MKIDNYKLERFRENLSETGLDNEIVTLLLDGDEVFQDFYELCSDYSHISINAEKIQVDTRTLGCIPSEIDIDIAVSNTIGFISDYEINKIEALLELIHKLHPFAIKHEDEKNQSGLVRNDSNSGFYGVYYTFNELPDKTWEEVKKKILEELSK